MLYCIGMNFFEKWQEKCGVLEWLRCKCFQAISNRGLARANPKTDKPLTFSCNFSKIINSI
ncbi:hypothetical protein CR203_20030 [Salipaludibacillus neizhouensis]|uniref:Uncharacterized protein n=1 Tax=Salipaludibacillus neizhouensis TaxID=885475 RepID=A0A3A9K410_9BACI|nr:hypothetical protein CR203_20030 [Salipaludibacillus neizhouensis]